MNELNSMTVHDVTWLDEVISFATANDYGVSLKPTGGRTKDDEPILRISFLSTDSPASSKEPPQKTADTFKAELKKYLETKLEKALSDMEEKLFNPSNGDIEAARFEEGLKSGVSAAYYKIYVDYFGEEAFKEFYIPNTAKKGETK